jgi:transcriptional regulator with XRE-family HTH domain
MDSVRTLKQWRLARGYSTRQLAQIAGLTKGTIVALEVGRSKGWPQTWKRVADALGVQPEQIAEYRQIIGLADTQ